MALPWSNNDRSWHLSRFGRHDLFSFVTNILGQCYRYQIFTWNEMKWIWVVIIQTQLDSWGVHNGTAGDTGITLWTFSRHSSLLICNTIWLFSTIKSHWSWYKRHDWEQNLCFLLGSTTVDQEGGKLRTSLYDKRDDFNFNITNVPFPGSNIPSSPACSVLAHGLYSTAGLAPHINILFWEQRDFHVIFVKGTFETVP